MWKYAIPVAALAGLAFAFGPEWLESRNGPPQAETPAQSSIVVMPPDAPPLQADQPTDSPAASDATPEPQFAPEHIALMPPHDVVEASRLRFPGNGELVFSDLSGPTRNQVCTDSTGYRWACGLYARVQLHTLIKDVALDCIVDERPDPKLMRGRCSTPSGGIAEKLVAEGWGIPAEPTSPEMTQKFLAAQQAHLGMWTLIAPK